MKLSVGLFLTAVMGAAATHVTVTVDGTPDSFFDVIDATDMADVEEWYNYHSEGENPYKASACTPKDDNNKGIEELNSNWIG